MSHVLQARKTSSQYVAFLRGINVGGHASIKMVDLKAAFERMGFQEVRTVLASGNVIFAAITKDSKTLAKEIEAGLKKVFQKDIGVLVRRLDDLKQLRSAQPFAGIMVTPSMRLYVTFFSEPTGLRTIAITYSTPKGEFRILQATAGEVFSVVDLAKGKGTPEAMIILEKSFGTNMATRNWNTILKILNH
jgi:uncharacterized protein (DUF1697 family)